MPDTLERGQCSVCGMPLVSECGPAKNIFVCPNGHLQDARLNQRKTTESTPKETTKEEDFPTSDITLKGEVSAFIISTINDAGKRRPLKEK